MKISIISGSTREGRTSHRVALALNSFFKSNEINSTIIDLKELTFQPFEERLRFLENKPQELIEVSETLKNSDSLIFLTPEYNGSFSSAIKNFIDLFGREEFAGKPIGVAAASTGVMGGIRAAHQLQQIVLAIQAYPQPQMLLSGEVNKHIDEEGNMLTPEYEKKLVGFASALIAFTQKFK